MPIKSFRGMIADGGIDTITLHTNTGSTGYRIKKFQVMTADIPGSIESSNLIALFKYEQDAVAEQVSFDDPTLLAAIDYRQHDNEAYGIVANQIVFDNEIFNQDIYITHIETLSNKPCNYYMELEQVKLDLNENTVATLKDIRNIAGQWVNNII